MYLPPESQLSAFITHIWEFYQHEQRAFAWRYVDDPYCVVVSEIMLQQTQTHRVVPKYAHFIDVFPDFTALAHASTRDLLSCWQGLGYNRRALALQKIAHTVTQQHGGALPADPTVLVTFPGIGPATAASICAFAFNQPTVFIETNIRTVFIHHFFPHQQTVSDKEIMPLVTATCDRNDPRSWYYALMDYGVMLKKQTVNPARKSMHYAKQSKFQGSDRQVRGAIIRYLTQHEHVTIETLTLALGCAHERVATIVQELCDEQFILFDKVIGKYRIKD